MEIYWSSTSQRKVNEIIEYISNENVDAAIALVEEFENRVCKLKEHPKSGRIVPTLNNEMVRQIVVHSNYLIIYEINQNRIDILTIRHARQDDKDFEI